MAWGSFIGGIFLGVIIGLFTAGLLDAARKSSDYAESYKVQHPEDGTKH